MIQDYARSRQIPPVNTAELKQFSKQGRTLRAKLKRSTLGTRLDFDRDPVTILEGQNSVRIRELVPVRMGRMAQLPSAFFRGAAAIMAHDLATTPITGITVQALASVLVRPALRAHAARSLRLVLSNSAKGRVKKNELPLPNWLSAQIVPP